MDDPWPLLPGPILDKINVIRVIASGKIIVICLGKMNKLGMTILLIVYNLITYSLIYIYIKRKSIMGNGVLDTF